MKVSLNAVALGFVSLPRVIAWGSLGHITTAYLAGHFVSNSTEAYFKELLSNNDDDYLAKVALWADSIKHTKWGHFTETFHFIDAHDNPPLSCNVDFARDCKKTGCVINALANYTEQFLDHLLPVWRRVEAAKFIVHFVGDLHQPLHNEDVARGGNDIFVKWDTREFNLHHIWDSSIAEKWIGGLRGKPDHLAQKWANQLAIEITDGKFTADKETWLKDFDLNKPNGTAMAWSREANALVCTHVLPQGPQVIVGKELSGDYFSKAGPIVEKQVARAGFRMAAWLDSIANEFQMRKDSDQMAEEL
ncbi:putative nuclease S1 precursor [Ilyonectria robusta]|uniref:putative nuclease S1 precursor n=1 Tax=Ilyonectria robusta TaxID=1079257 RepID=UPI001E8CE127|nr:putative nuclease S1 precursor [Ilyonectria robusta]KAH8646430.1 putative nuclease S1 precursor [Ilyonectria robusta]